MTGNTMAMFAVAATTECLRTKRRATMTVHVSMSAIDATSPTPAKGAVRSSSGGEAYNQVLVRGGGGDATIRPDESMAAHRPVLADRTMGVRVSIQRNRANCRCWVRPRSYQPNQPSLLMFTNRSAARARPPAAGYTKSRVTQLMASSKQMAGAIRTVRPCHGISKRTGSPPRSRSKVMPAAPTASSERSSQSQLEMYGMVSPNGAKKILS